MGMDAGFADPVDVLDEHGDYREQEGGGGDVVLSLHVVDAGAGGGEEGGVVGEDALE